MGKKNIKLFGWDSNVDYDTAYKQILEFIKEIDKRDRKGVKAVRAKAYAIVLLIQLRNGARVGEAVDALYKICKNYTREVEVTVEKRKDGATRKIVLPKQIKRSDILEVAGFVINEYENTGKRKLVIRISRFARDRFGFNTHSLRYAFITKLARDGVAAQLISKITMHKSLDYILYYTQKTQAEDILRHLDS